MWPEWIERSLKTSSLVSPLLLFSFIPFFLFVNYRNVVVVLILVISWARRPDGRSRKIFGSFLWSVRWKMGEIGDISSSGLLQHSPTRDCTVHPIFCLFSPVCYYWAVGSELYIFFLFYVIQIGKQQYTGLHSSRVIPLKRLIKGYYIPFNIMNGTWHERY